LLLGCLPALFNFLARRAPRAKEKLRSMEQCFRAKAAKHRLLAGTLFRDCSMVQARGGPGFFHTEVARHGG